jgi:hypothetical protein
MSVKNYVSAWTEDFREWLAWKIFPEQAFYMEAVRRMAEIDENFRCIDALEEADSACSGWAVEVIKVKLTPLAEMMKQLEEEYGETPF